MPPRMRPSFFVPFLMGTLLLSVLPAWAAVSTPVPSQKPPVRLQMPYEPASLDPHKIEGFEYRIVTDLFEGLTIYSATDAVIPGVAESWETSPDGLVWTFHLRPEAAWSDGAPLTAEDFVYSFRRALDPATACPYTLPLLSILNAQEISDGREKDLTKLGVSALDAHTFRITLAKPTPWLLMTLTGQTSMPVPRQAIEKWGDKWTLPEHMVSNGAFTLKKWVPLGEVDLARNERFRDAASVQIDEVDYMLADDSKAALKRYENGELDVVNDVLGQDLPRVKRERPDELRTFPLLGTRYFAFNMDGPLGKDPRVRQALAMVIDRDVLESKVLRSDQLPAYSFTPPNMPGYTPPKPDWSDRPMAERIAAAQKLLADAGAPKPFKIHMLSFKNDLEQLYTRAIFEMWHAALGVEAEEEVVETRIAFDRLNHHDFEATFTSWAADYPDAWIFHSIFLSDAGELNFVNYKNDQFDALLDRSRNASSPAERSALLQSAEKLLLDEQIVIPVDYGVAHLLVKPHLHGYEPALINVHPSRFLSVVEAR
ncbi:MAG TPA: peptide ABC transporter substrate-binding protein [Aliidongia sp.]|nr:peptide ABC transporter substrate-binding protein [Aliidongia sp.]